MDKINQNESINPDTEINQNNSNNCNLLSSNYSDISDLQYDKLEMYAMCYNFCRIMDKIGWNAKHGKYCGMCGYQTNNDKNPYGGTLRYSENTTDKKEDPILLIYDKILCTECNRYYTNKQEVRQHNICDNHSDFEVGVTLFP